MIACAERLSNSSRRWDEEYPEMDQNEMDAGFYIHHILKCSSIQY